MKNKEYKLLNFRLDKADTSMLPKYFFKLTKLGNDEVPPNITDLEYSEKLNGRIVVCVPNKPIYKI